MADLPVNPKILSWTAPDEDVSGEPIDYEMDYELGLVDPDTRDVTPLMILPATLNEGGSFEAPLSDITLGRGKHTVALRAIRRDAKKLKSDWSQTVTYLNAEVPEAPLDLKVS